MKIKSYTLYRILSYSTLLFFVLFSLYVGVRYFGDKYWGVPLVVGFFTHYVMKYIDPEKF